MQLALFGAWGAWAVSRAPARRAPVVVAAWAAAVAVAWTVDPGAVALSALEPVREGDAVQRAHTVLGGGAAPAWPPWAVAIGQDVGADLPALVVQGAAFAAAAAVGLAAWARQRAGSWGVGLAIVAGLALSPAGRVAVLSGEPGPGLWPWVMMAVHGMAVASSGPSRAIGGGFAVAALAVLSTVRPELLALGAGPVAVAALRRVPWGRLRPSVPVGVAGAVVAAILAVVSAQALILWDHPLKPVAMALHPLDASLVWAWPSWLAMWTPGIVLLAVRGAVTRAGAGLAVGWLVATRAQHAAAHGTLIVPAIVDEGLGRPAALELLRYTGLGLPVVAVLAVLGAAACAPRGRAVLAALALVPAAPSLLPMHDGTPGWTPWGHVDRDATREVRALAGVLRADPAAGIQLRTHPDDTGAARWIGLCGAAACAGLGVIGPADAPPVWPEGVGRRWTWWGTSCADRDAACAPVPADAVWSWTFAARPHADPSHGLDTIDEVVFALAPTPSSAGGAADPSR